MDDTSFDALYNKYFDPERVAQADKKLQAQREKMKGYRKILWDHAMRQIAESVDEPRHDARAKK